MNILVIGDFHGKLPLKLRREIGRERLDLVIGVGDYAGIEDWRPYVLYCMKSKKTGERKSPEEFFGKREFKKLMEKDYDAGEEALDFLDSLGVPFVSVFGNGDEEWFEYPFGEGIWELNSGRAKYLRGLKNFRDITYGVMNRDGVSILGLGGYVDVKGNFDAGEKESLGYLNVLDRLDRTRGKLDSLVKGLRYDAKIFVFHYPVKGVFDVIRERGNVYDGVSVGIDFFRDAVEREGPGLVLCGHMHEYQGAEKVGESLVVNPGAACDGKCCFVDFDERKGKVKSVRFVG